MQEWVGTSLYQGRPHCEGEFDQGFGGSARVGYD